MLINDCVLKTKSLHSPLKFSELERKKVVGMNPHTKITIQWLPAELFAEEGIFRGQHVDGRPYGFVQFIGAKLLYEGEVKGNEAYGWGRYIFGRDQCHIGYWQDEMLQGNGRKYRDGKITKEGWFENNELKKGYDMET